MIISKRTVPGPPNYDNRGLKQKIHGFYMPGEAKCSVIGTTAYEKKYVPGPNAYESRGKPMAEILKEKAKSYLYVHKPDYSKTSCKIKKTNDPAPTSYEPTKALEKSASMRDSIKNTIPKAKNANFLSKFQTVKAMWCCRLIVDFVLL